MWAVLHSWQGVIKGMGVGHVSNSTSLRTMDSRRQWLKGEGPFGRTLWHVLVGNWVDLNRSSEPKKQRVWWNGRERARGEENKSLCFCHSRIKGVLEGSISVHFLYYNQTPKAVYIYNVKRAQTWLCIPARPATWEAKVGGLLSEASLEPI
jgi:hypothetical protein